MLVERRLADQGVAAAEGLWGEADELATRIFQLIGSLPDDDLPKGYRLSPATKADLRRVMPLLREAAEILQQADDREDPIYEAYCERLDAEHIS